MLPKKYRLPSYLIPQVLKKGKRFTSSLLTLIISPSLEDQFSNFAFIVSVKVDKRASKRNQLKRQMREGVRQQLDKVKDGYNIVFLINKSSRRREAQLIMTEELVLLRQARLIKGIKGFPKKSESN